MSEHLKQSNICKFSSNRSADLVCSYFVCERQNALRNKDVINDYLIGLVTAGNGRLFFKKVSYELSEGSMFFVLPDTEFSIDSSSAWEYTYIRFNGRQADELFTRFGISAEHCVFENCDFLKEFWMGCLEQASSENLDLFAQSALIYAFAHLQPPSQKEPNLITTIIRLTNQNFTNHAFSLRWLGENLNYNPKYLSDVFKRKKGVLFSQYLQELRIEHAVFLMEQGLISIKNIAILSGFSDVFYFSKIFKQKKGLTPTKYMEQFESDF